jgi:hypothetical protein
MISHSVSVGNRKQTGPIGPSGRAYPHHLAALRANGGTLGGIAAGDLPNLVFELRDDHLAVRDNAPHTRERVDAEKRPQVWLEASWQIAAPT